MSAPIDTRAERPSPRFVSPTELKTGVTIAGPQLLSEITRGKEIDLTGSLAIVSGASHGIGRAIALKLGYHGAGVVGISREPSPESEQTIKDLVRIAPIVAWVYGDVTDENTAKTVVENIGATEGLGAADILVNNAGTTKDVLFLRMSEADWDKVVDLKLKGAFLMTKAAIRSMLRLGRGRIINITSDSAAFGNPGQANYGAANAGVEGLTRSNAREFAGKGVTVNAVSFGLIDTPLTRPMKDEHKQAIYDMTPLPGETTAEDAAEMVLFLASNRASRITGQVFNVDGGLVFRV